MSGCRKKRRDRIFYEVNTALKDMKYEMEDPPHAPVRVTEVAVRSCPCGRYALHIAGCLDRAREAFHRREVAAISDTLYQHAGGAHSSLL